ncbi:DUF2845 domain-containing protein [Pseudomonas coleopterorum]|jgi:hypothetical protein|uniref:DUF2845 domain-containing protein n=1 Tax=Pseudomonas coleopterorum TaxID=1605838 RepID=A0ABR9C636_9PSED|nr:DUF2845 domain-containing protein [Pseudomonas coleopterorum]MBD8483677.1 DUF2845 domain-containing protein [Pseudomonas coleopterorum]MBD8757556.1 DUF2845 domain-containing protein [Pseudomonas coleopterorum]MBD8771973.1 DUF2845 domain-containing protein [Pseudomonas coleopterorum]
MNTLTWMTCATLLLALCNTASAASTMRCGSALVSLNDRTVQVEQKCGAPASKAQTGYERSGPINRRVELPIEEWVYGPSNGMSQYLKFVGSRLVEIESSRN